MKCIMKIFNDDILDLVNKSFEKIDYKNKICFLCILGTSIIAYGFQLSNVVMSPDMYYEIVTGDYSISYSGRWFMAIIREFILYDHRIVPTFNLIISITLFIISSIIVTKIWRITKPFYVFFISTIITVNSYTCHILRFENANIEAAITTLIATYSIYLSGKKSVKHLIYSFMLITCAHGGYQTGVSFSCTVFFCAIVIWLVQDESFKFYKKYLKYKILPAVTVLLLGFIANKIILKIIIAILGLKAGKRLQFTEFASSPIEIYENIKYVFKVVPSIFTFQTLYFNFSITLIYKILIILFLISLFIIVYKNKTIEGLLLYITVITFTSLSLLSIYLPTIIIGYKYTSNRMLFPFGVFISLLFTIGYVSKHNIIKNTAVICTVLLIFLYSWHNNMYMYRSFIQDRADFEMASRIVARIERAPDFERVNKNPMKICFIGTKDIYRPGYKFTSWPKEKIRREGAYRQWWSAVGIFQYLHVNYKKTDENYLENLSLSNNDAYKIFNMKEWPSSGAVEIINDTAIIMFDKKQLPNNIKKIIFENGDEKNKYSIPIRKSDFISISNIDTYKDNGTFLCKGNDPSLIFRFNKMNEKEKYIMKISLYVPSNTGLQIFYKINMEDQFKEEESETVLLEKGFNDKYFFVDGLKRCKEIRIDPGWVKGKYIIKSIEFYSIEKE